MVFTEMKVFEFYLNPLSFGGLGPLEVKGSGLLEPPEAILRYSSSNLHPSSLGQTYISWCRLLDDNRHRHWHLAKCLTDRYDV